VRKPIVLLSIVMSAVFLTTCTSTQKETRELGEPASLNVGQQGPPSSQVAKGRPILYLDFPSKKGDPVVIRGVYQDGRRVQSGIQNTLTMPTWSIDGEWFAYVIGDPITTWTSFVIKDPKTTEATLAVSNMRGDVRTLYKTKRERILVPPIWSPDGRRIAVILVGSGSSPLSIAVLEVGSQKVSSRFELSATPSHPISGSDMSISLEVFRSNYDPNRPTLRLNKFRWSPDGQKILLSWITTLVINTLTGAVETVADKPVLAEWAANSDGVYYFELLSESPRDKPYSGGITLGNFYFKRLGAEMPNKLMDKEHLEVLGMTKWTGQRYGFMSLSPMASKLAIKGYDPAGGSVVHIYSLTEGGTLALDKPLKSIRTSDGIMALEWAPDDSSLAAVVIGKGSMTLLVKLLDLGTAEWRTLAKIAEDLSGNFNLYEGVAHLYAYGHRTLSWTY
jgi:hypothetical protein